MFKTILFSFLMIAFCSIELFSEQKIANYLGNGSAPRLYIELGNNGPQWKGYKIDYQGIGSVPWSSDPSKNWSVWNVMDEKGNYYGTITLTSDGKQVKWGGYTTNDDGYYLENIVMSYNSNVNANQLTAEKVIQGKKSSPFPDAPIATPALYESSQTPIKFQVNDDSIVNDHGTKLILKGIVRPSLEWNPQGQFLSPQDIDTMRSWGANVIRLDLNQNYWFESGPVTQMGSYKQIINAIVYYAIQNKMAVILDLHWVENGRQSPMANKDSIKFWTEVATDYKDFGTVIFELYNEPENIGSAAWLNGNNQYAGFQELYNAVRGAGADNLVIVNGLDWGYDISFVNDDFKVEGYNIVYGSHPYNQKGANDWTGPGGSFDNNFKGVLGKFPIIFTEFGVNSAEYFPTKYKQVYERILSYINQHDINYSAFAWWVEANRNNADVFPTVIKDWQGTPLNGGEQIHEDLQMNPPLPIE